MLFRGGSLGDMLCEQFERTVDKDNCVPFEGLTLQVPSDRHHCHYVRAKAKVQVHRFQDCTLAVITDPGSWRPIMPKGLTADVPHPALIKMI